MSRDRGKPLGHTVLMDSDEFDATERLFNEAFRERLRIIQGSRKDAQMADLLGLGTDENAADRYNKWKNRGGFPMFVLPKLAALGATTVEELVKLPQKPPAPPNKTKKQSTG